MIRSLSGTITNITGNSLTLSVSGIGFEMSVPNSCSFTAGKAVTITTYMHWNSDQGPSLYGFSEKLERSVFLLIIDCPKIGPKIALSILGQMSAGQFLETVNSQNASSLSNLKGIGAKKAETIIMQLKGKVSKLISSGALEGYAPAASTIDWQSLSEALATLGYSKQEVTNVMQHLGKLSAEDDYTFDKLLRAGLSYLSKTG